MKHVVAYKKYQETKAELELMKSKFDNPESNTDIQDGINENIEVDLETEDYEIKRYFNEDEIVSIFVSQDV